MILWDSRLVHQGGVAASARASQAVAPSGHQHRGCYGRMVAYMCGLAASSVSREGASSSCGVL